MSKKANIPRQRGTPSPSNRVSPHRTTGIPKTSVTTSSNSHRRTGSGSKPVKQLYRRDTEDNDLEHDVASAQDMFLANSLIHPVDRADDEVHSIYCESLDPRARNSIESLVNEQRKKVAAAGGSGVATSLSCGAPGFGSAVSRKGSQRGVAPSGAFRANAVAQAAPTNPEADNLSDKTEVETYNSSGNKRAVIQPQRAPRDMQELARDILDRGLTRDEITQLAAELLNAGRTPTPQQRASPKRQSQSYKSGSVFSNDDIEVQLHNHLNESCRIIPAATHHNIASTTYYNGSHSTTPNHMHPKYSPSNAPSRAYCPTVNREISPNNDTSIPEIPVVSNKTPKVPKLELPERISSFPDSLGPLSPRSDISVGSSNSAFTESSKRSSIINWCGNLLTPS